MKGSNIIKYTLLWLLTVTGLGAEAQERLVMPAALKAGDTIANIARLNREFIKAKLSD